MATEIDLPEDVVRSAQAQVASGRFSSVAEVLRAGIDAVAECQQAEQDWLSYARAEAEEGFAALDRGEGILTTPGQLVSRLDREVRARQASRRQQ